MRPGPRWRLDRLSREERGASQLTFMLLAPVLVLLVGLVADGAAQIRATLELQQLLAAAARAGANSISVQTVVGFGPGIDASARQTALGHLSAHGLHDAAATVRDGEIAVTASTAVATRFLSLIAIDELPVTASASAVLVITPPP